MPLTSQDGTAGERTSRGPISSVGVKIGKQRFGGYGDAKEQRVPNNVEEKKKRSSDLNSNGKP